MPVVDYNSQRTWSAFYRQDLLIPGHPLNGTSVGYSREYAKIMKLPELDDITWHREYWALLAAAAGIPNSATVACIGAGFGWLVEAAIDAGWPNVQAVDDSDWILAHKNDLAWRFNGSVWVQDEVTAQVPIIQASLDSPIPLRNALGGRQDWVITESMLSSLWSPADPLFDGTLESDELTNAFNNCETVAVATNPNILHLITLAPRGDFHRKTLAEWKALRPGHLFAPNGPIPGFAVI